MHLRLQETLTFNCRKYGYDLDKNRREVEMGTKRKMIKKLFSIPFLTMLGIWILVYYQVTSHYHNFRYGWNTYQVGR